MFTVLNEVEKNNNKIDILNRPSHSISFAKGRSKSKLMIVYLVVKRMVVDIILYTTQAHLKSLD